MFTEKDYADYFKDLQNAERQMIAGMDSILSDISDDEIKIVLSGIRNDEFRHLRLEDKLLEILESHSIKP